MLRLKFNKQVPKQELKQIEKKFKQCLKEKWTLECNVLELSRTDLYGHMLALLVKTKVDCILKKSVSQLLDFLFDVSEKYTQEAPYHTFYHAADIMTMLYYFCYDLNANQYLSDSDIAFLIVAALCHDMGHPGYNNTFQINTKSELALRYGNQSVLENYSIDLTFELFDKHQIKTTNQIKNFLTDLIISTDMIYHKELVNEARQLKHKKNLNKKRLCCILLHLADISNMARPWKISKLWSDLITKEVYNQGDEEIKRGIKLSAGMDREVCSQKEISLKFGEMILPLFESLVSLLPKSHVLVDLLASNRIQWECLDHRKRKMRRVSSDIIILPTCSGITFKRIRLGFRSQSYPTLLYHHSNHNNHHSISDPEQIPTTLLPLVNFKSTFIYDTNTNLESIVLYHPYDQ